MTTDSDEGELLLQVAGILPPADFHPFVVRLAHRLHLRGWVRHEAIGASLRIVGAEDDIVQLIRGICDDAPPSLRLRGMNPGAITPELPPVGDAFVALADDLGCPAPTPHDPAPLAHVA